MHHIPAVSPRDLHRYPPSSIFVQEQETDVTRDDAASTRSAADCFRPPAGTSRPPARIPPVWLREKRRVLRGTGDHLLECPWTQPEQALESSGRSLQPGQTPRSLSGTASSSHHSIIQDQVRVWRSLTELPQQRYHLHAVVHRMSHKMLNLLILQLGPGIAAEVLIGQGSVELLVRQRPDVVAQFDVKLGPPFPQFCQRRHLAGRDQAAGARAFPSRQPHHLRTINMYQRSMDALKARA